MRTNEIREDLRGGTSRFISIVGMLSLILGLGAVVSRPARAEIQNDLVGFSPNHVFESAEAGEHIDVMSGNLTLTIPIGPRYKLTDEFEYGITLYYNSKIWEHECPEVVSEQNPCPGTLPPDGSVGLGFSLLPGRVYHHADDKSYVFRVQLEDGSEHFFCDPLASGYGGDPNASGCTLDVNTPYTNDIAHIRMERLNNAAGQQGWLATMPGGNKIIFGRVLNTNTHEALATRLESVSMRSPSAPAGWVEYSYDTSHPDLKYAVTQITDSHGRSTGLAYSDEGPSVRLVTITVPTFVNPVGSPGSSPPQAVYKLHLESVAYEDPSYMAGAPESRRFLKRIEFPEMSESYQFEYTRTGWPTYGWLLQRTLPTGAKIDYYYEVYGTSLYRPFHTELRSKTLTLSPGEAPFRWSWNRFAVGPVPSPLPHDAAHPDPSAFFAGSNPYQATVRDPFNNLTVYQFLSTIYNLQTPSSTCNARGECVNNWSDGLLDSVSTYMGPDPDSSRLIRRVEYKWDNDIDTTTGEHKMLRYRGSEVVLETERHHATAVNARQVEERTLVPSAGGSPLSTVKVKYSNWSGLCARQTDEYVDDVLYRSTYKESSTIGCLYPHSVAVKNATGSVVSRTDSAYNNGRLWCEVRRKGSTGVDFMSDCDNGLALNTGDVATVNAFDDTTGVAISTTVRGGDVSGSADRVSTKEYLKLANGDRTGYLTTKTIGSFVWKAVDRSVDFNTGLTSATNDIAGNTTTYVWDGLGRLKEIHPASVEKATLIEYQDVHTTRVTQALASDNFVETIYTYDGLGRLILTKRRNAASTYDIQRTDYDIAGRVTRKSEWAPDLTSDANLKWTTYDYTSYTDLDAAPGTVSKHPDPLGRIHGVTTPDDLTPLTPATETTYSGNVTTVTVRDIQGWVNGGAAIVASTTVYTNDALGRLISVDSPSPGANAEYSYDESDNLTEVRLIDPADESRVQVRRFVYDRLGRLRTASNPENGTVEYTSYDARGNLLSHTDARQNVLKMAYDDADRLLTRSQMSPSGCGGDQLLESNTYDNSSGRLTRQESRKLDYEHPSPAGTQCAPSKIVSTVNFGYGEKNMAAPCPLDSGGYNGAAGFTGLNGRLSWQTTVIRPSGITLRTDYCQDALGMPTIIGYPDVVNSGRTHSQVGTTYKNGYLTELGDPARQRPYISAVTYAAGGIPTVIERASSTDYVDLDLRHRPARFRTVGHAYTVPNGPGFAARSVHGPYPHLIAAPGGGDEGGDPGGTEVPPPPAPANWNSGLYAYDMAGNVYGIGNESYNYDVLSRLVHGSIPGVGTTNYDVGYAYDAFGNMTGQARTVSGNPASTIQRNYTIDWHTNRVGTQTRTGGASWAYAYDESGNRATDGTLSYFFDGQGRLREVMDPEKGRIGNYDYDAAGYRVRAEADGFETFYYRDAAGQVLSEYQRPIGSPFSPVWNKDYIYALGKVQALVRNDAPPIPKRPWATLPPSPADLTTGLTLNWTSVDAPDMLGYHLEFRWKNHAADTIEQLAVQDVLDSTDHWVYYYTSEAAASCLTFTVRSVDTAGNVSAPSLPLIVCPLAAAPPAPTGVYALPSDKSVTIRWTQVTGQNTYALGYYVEQQGDRLNNVLLTATEFRDTGLANGTDYSYTVRAVDTSNRTSAASTPAVVARPLDNVAPGKVLGVFAEPDRAANRIKVSWKRGVDPDVGDYYVYRLDSDVAPTTESPIGTVHVVAGQEQPSYSIVDSTSDTAVVGKTYFYCVTAADRANPPNPPNISAPSDRASAKARRSLTGAPVTGSVSFSVFDNGTTSSAGRPGSYLDFADTHAEDDDVVKATVHWTATGQFGYRIYRQASAEEPFVLVGSLSSGTPQEFPDATIKKGDYTYFVAGLNSYGEETAPDTLPGSGSGVFQRHVDWLSPSVAVRNLVVTDSRFSFLTDNKKSRFATVNWSRVTEPELVGYNIYRMCSFSTCEEDMVYGWMDTFTCEPNWIRLNATPIPPEQRFFEDASVGGLGGCFMYALRPVGPNYVEGPISKITVAQLAGNLNPNPLPTGAADHSQAADYVPTDTVPTLWPLVDTVLNGVNGSSGINDIVHGTGSPAGPPPAVQSVTVTTGTKPALINGTVYYFATRFARVSWSWGSIVPPIDLVGFHIEVAGSRNGPWQRLTKRPVAWWENHYTSQGVAIDRCSGVSGHMGCLSYRVIAVDEDGNESAPVEATQNPLVTACPATPAPPNLRVSNGPTTSPPYPHCSTRLEWDASPDAAYYYVYRLIISPNYPPYFYDTKRVPANGQATSYSYDEAGDDWGEESNRGLTANDYCPDFVCGYPDYYMPSQFACAYGYLEAYYVTAAKATGGESPRSNLVFWKCNTSDGVGYDSKVLSDEIPTDAIAAMPAITPSESLACWNTDGDSLPLFDRVEDVQREPTHLTALATAPMLRLGQSAEVPWRVYELHTDHLGSVRVITNVDGGLESLHNYFPFGEETVDQDSYNTHRYTGHEHDKETGLDYMLARYYEAGVGRFVSFDSSRQGSDRRSPQSWNGYTYVANNPMGKVDLNGLYEQNFHEGWTYMLAKQAGYSESEARTIASADNGVDSGRTNPFICGSALRTKWHGFDADRKALESNALNAKTLGELGTMLHPYQDSFAHQSFPASTGHMTSGSTPDKTSSAPNKAVLAGMGTYDILNSKATQSGKSGFGAPDTGLMKSLADTNANVTSYDPGSKNISVEVEGADNASKLAADLKARGYTVQVIKQ